MSSLTSSPPSLASYSSSSSSSIHPSMSMPFAPFVNSSINSSNSFKCPLTNTNNLPTSHSLFQFTNGGSKASVTSGSHFINSSMPPSASLDSSLKLFSVENKSSQAWPDSFEIVSNSICPFSSDPFAS